MLKQHQTENQPLDFTPFVSNKLQMFTDKKLFHLLSQLISCARHAAISPNVSNMTRYGPESNPTPPQLQTGSLLFIQMLLKGLILILIMSSV